MNKTTDQLRDQLAGQAMQALIARQYELDRGTALLAYHMADYMLEAKAYTKKEATCLK